MKMIAFIFVLIAFTVSCKPRDAVTVDLANACAAENEKKYLSTSAFLKPGVSIYCSNRGGRMDCSLDAVAAPDGQRVFGADIEEGSGANQIEKITGSYKREDLKIHDNAGGVINLADKFELTGEMNVVPGSVCFMEVDKIEKAR
jgi:hypothetical protein